MHVLGDGMQRFLEIDNFSITRTFYVSIIAFSILFKIQLAVICAHAVLSDRLTYLLYRYVFTSRENKITAPAGANKIKYERNDARRQSDAAKTSAGQRQNRCG